MKIKKKRLRLRNCEDVWKWELCDALNKEEE